MTDFKPGEIVDITIKGVRIAAPSQVWRGHQGRTAILDEHGEAYVLPPQAAIERVTPEHWPPQPGDVWADREDVQWFAYEGTNTIYFQAATDRFHGASALALSQTRSPLTLKYRPQPQPDPWAEVPF